MPFLEQKLQTTQDITTRIRYAGRLGRLCPDHAGAIDVLLHYLRTSQNKTHLKHASDYLQEMLSGDTVSLDSDITRMLVQVRDIYLNPICAAQYQAAYKILWHGSRIFPHHQFCHLWQSVQRD